MFTLSTFTKVVLGAGIITGGIFVSGIVWNGGESINNIKATLENMKNEFVQVVEDNEFLKEQFDRLKGLYSESVEEANSRIDELTRQRDNLYLQLEALKGEVIGDSEIAEEQEAIQNEINRLENELEIANQQIAELQAYAQQIDDSTQYEALDRKAYTAVELELKDIRIPIDGEALNYNRNLAEAFAKQSTVQAIEEEYRAKGGTIKIERVTVYKNGATHIAYLVSDDSKFSGSVPTVKALAQEHGVSYVYFVKGGNSEYYEAVRK